MTLLYGTGNPAKLSSMRGALAPLGVDLLGLREMPSPAPEIRETGVTPSENARIKALAYYEAFRRPVFSCDSGFYIEGLTDSEQPGARVRIVNGKQLDDEEMIVHYAAISERLGGLVRARYLNAVCLVINDLKIYEGFGPELSGAEFYLAAAPHKRRVEGYPLDSLSVHIETGKYYYDLEDKYSVDGNWAEGFRRFFRMSLGLPSVP